MHPYKPFREFTLQWHITNRCEMDCRYCYIKDSQRREEMSLKDFKKALKNYQNFLKYYNLSGRIYFTGGDPLLHKSFWSFLKIIKEANINFAIMGNYHFLNEKILQKLRKHNIYFYQLSIDGMKKIHDHLRGKDSFKKTFEAIKLLEGQGIKTVVNITVSNKNIEDVPFLIKKLSRTPLTRVDFTRFVSIGRGTAQTGFFTPSTKFKDLLLKTLKTEKEIRKYNKKLQIGKKDHLWKLLFFENNKLKINLKNKAYGCGMGYRHLTLLPNGNLLLCRKIERKIGNLLENDLVWIYENSELIKKILENKLIEACMNCSLKNVCRGCPAVAYATQKDFKTRDPQCWIKT